MEQETAREKLRTELMEVCRNLSERILYAQQAMASDSKFVFSDTYRLIRNELRLLNARLQELKKQRKNLQHHYSVIIEGDVFKDGKLVRNYPVSCEISSVIDCQLGDQTSLSRNKGSHKAFRNLLKARFGNLFLDRKFRMGYIVQLR